MVRMMAGRVPRNLKPLGMQMAGLAIDEVVVCKRNLIRIESNDPLPVNLPDIAKGLSEHGLKFTDTLRLSHVTDNNQ